MTARRLPPLTVRQFNDAIFLCQRAQGATTEELSDVLLGRPSFDSPTVLRRYLKRYKPELELKSERTPQKQKSNWRGKPHGNRLTYFVVPAMSGGIWRRR